MLGVVKTTALRDVNYLVVGLGVSGFSAARYLLGAGYRCRVQDTRDIPPYLSQLRDQFVALDFQAGALQPDLIDWADVLVVSPGISLRQAEFDLAREQDKEIIGDVELFARLVDKPVVAITGSNGKSTVTSLVGEIVKVSGIAVAVGGNLGIAALDLLEQDAELLVLELSSYQLESLKSLRPSVAALLNLSEDHLDRYDSYDDYVAAKRHIYDYADVCISNLDDPATTYSSEDVRFGFSTDAEFHLLEDDGIWLAHRGEAWLRVDQLKITGRHNWSNCLAAMAITQQLGISREAIVTGLKQFVGIPHRSQWVAEFGGVEWINDSKATNVGAAQASIEGRDRPVILIAGGQSKGADMSLMVNALQRKVKLVLLLGEDASLMEQAWRTATRIERVADMREAVLRARDEAVSGDCVLLAPACASFDMYEKFEARGEDFIRLVAEIQHG